MEINIEEVKRETMDYLDSNNNDIIYSQDYESSDYESSDYESSDYIDTSKKMSKKENSNFNFPIKLITKPTQFVRGKTDDVLIDIAKRALQKKEIYNEYTQQTEHTIDIVFTNNSLAETKQWKSRTGFKFNKFKNINIDIVSSKSKDSKNIGQYVTQRLISCEKIEDLPNILIACSNKIRCNDVIDLIKIFAADDTFHLPFLEEHPFFKFHISFDEPDANLGIIKNFLKQIKKTEKKYPRFQLRIQGILFITATPIEQFWKMLRHHQISTLINCNKNSTENFDEYFKNYRCFEDHNINLVDDNTGNCLSYVMQLFASNRITNNTRNVIFAPAHIYTSAKGVGSHEEIKDFFLSMKYVVFIINGKFKGFITKDSRISLEDYNKKYCINNGELRDTLRHWNINNPYVNLAITGNQCVERGITFNTNGFNFTIAIISDYHLKSLGKLVQLIGRTTGGNKYVEKMTIFCSNKVKQTVSKFNERQKEICSLNPTSFNSSDFNNSNSTIPVKLEFTDISVVKELIKLRLDRKRGYKRIFHNMIRRSIRKRSCIVYDYNNVNKFNIKDRELGTVRMYDGKNSNNRRFKQFNEAFSEKRPTAQKCKEDEYCVDMASIEYVNGDFKNPINIIWITFRV